MTRGMHAHRSSLTTGLRRAPARVRRVIAWITAALAVTVWLGCEAPRDGAAEQADEPELGWLSLYVTASGASAYDGAHMTIAEVEIAADGAEAVELFESTHAADLVELEGVTRLFTVTEAVPAGAYRSVRLELGGAWVEPGEDGAAWSAVASPPDERVELRIGAPIVVGDGEHVSLELEIDVEASIRPDPEVEGALVLQPVIHAWVGRDAPPRRLVRMSGAVRSALERGRFDFCPDARVDPFPRVRHARPAPSTLVSIGGHGGVVIGFPVLRSHCFRVEVDDETGAFDRDGLPIPLEGLVGDAVVPDEPDGPHPEVTIAGRFELGRVPAPSEVGGGDDADGIAPIRGFVGPAQPRDGPGGLVLRARVVEERDDDRFEWLRGWLFGPRLDAPLGERSLVIDWASPLPQELIEVRLHEGTKLVDRLGGEYPLDALDVSSTVALDGVLTPGSESEPDRFDATLAVLGESQDGAVPGLPEIRRVIGSVHSIDPVAPPRVFVSDPTGRRALPWQLPVDQPIAFAWSDAVGAHVETGSLDEVQVGMPILLVYRERDDGAPELDRVVVYAEPAR